jgi:cytochrome c-type biogenesis protein CcmE
MTRSPNRARLVVALSVASALALFLVYTSLAGGASPVLRPSQLSVHDGEVGLGGIVVGSIRGDAHGAGLRFTLRDVDGTATARVLYRGSVPDLFRAGRHVYLRGDLESGLFVAVPGSLLTRCPSKYSAKDGG